MKSHHRRIIEFRAFGWACDLWLGSWLSFKVFGKWGRFPVLCVDVGRLRLDIWRRA